MNKYQEYIGCILRMGIMKLPEIEIELRDSDFIIAIFSSAIHSELLKMGNNNLSSTSAKIAKIRLFSIFNLLPLHKFSFFIDDICKIDFSLSTK